MTDRQTCTKEAPMPEVHSGRWEHPDAEEIEVDYGSMYGSYERYRCPHCGLKFWVELPD
jgi:hypothetical protein